MQDGSFSERTNILGQEQSFAQFDRNVWKSVLKRNKSNAEERRQKYLRRKQEIEIEIKNDSEERKSIEK